MQLTGKQARYLRGLAHHLKPVVLVGDSGVTAQVVEATREALEHHELIKVKVNSANGRDDVAEAAERLVVATGAVLAQVIGKTVVLYKAREKEPEIRLPRA